MNLLKYNRIILPLWLIINSLFNFSWIAFYPLMGYIVVVFNLLAFVSFLSISINKTLIALVVFLLLMFYLFIPREYGAPNTTIVLYFYSFIFSVLFFDKVIVPNSTLWCNSLFFLFTMAVFQELIVYMGFSMPYQEFEDSSQLFRLYRPFYIDRINIVKSELNLFLFDQRFHGPFFEPGNAGFAAFMMYTLAKNKIIRASSILFGVLSMSMFFFTLFFSYIIYRGFQKFKFQGLLFSLLICAVVVFLLLNNTDTFFYASTIGRFLGEGDKVLNTRNSIFEQEQIQLFEMMISNMDFNLFSGLGFDLPGSGGSYRQWIMSTGIFFNLLLIMSIVLVLFSKKKLKWSLLTLFIILLAPFLYTRGYWFDLNICILYASLKMEH